MDKYFDDISLMEKEVVRQNRRNCFFLSKNGLQILEIELIEWPHNPLEIFMVMWQVGAANLARKIKRMI